MTKRPRSPDSDLRTFLHQVAASRCGNPTRFGHPCRECAEATRDTFLDLLDGLPDGYRSLPAGLLATAVRKACGDA